MDNWGQGTFTLCVSRLYRRAIGIAQGEEVGFALSPPLLALPLRQTQVPGFHVSIECMEIDIGRERAHDAPLGCTGEGCSSVPVVQYPCTQELPEQISDIPVRYSFLDRFHEPPVRDRVKVAGYVSFYDPLEGRPAGACKPFTQVGHRVIGASIRPESVRMNTKVGFPYRFQGHAKGFLDNPVTYAGNA